MSGEMQIPALVIMFFLGLIGILLVFIGTLEKNIIISMCGVSVMIFDLLIMESIIEITKRDKKDI